MRTDGICEPRGGTGIEMMRMVRTHRAVGRGPLGRHPGALALGIAVVVGMAVCGPVMGAEKVGIRVDREKGLL